MPKINLIPTIRVEKVVALKCLRVTAGHTYLLDGDEFIFYAANRARCRAQGNEISVVTMWHRGEPIGADPQP